jgi:hypothetical protein
MHWIDPDSLSPVKATVERFLFNPKGDADGLLLTNGVEAHFPPHLSKRVLKQIKPGDAITLYGVKPRAADMIACVAIDPARGERIDDTGPPDKHRKPHPTGRTHRLEVEETIERLLHGPKGEVRGLLLSTGQIVRFPPHAAEATLKPGASIAVRGEAIEVADTQVIEARAWGKSKSHLKGLPAK